MTSERSALVTAGFVSRATAFAIDLAVLGGSASAIGWLVSAADAVLLPRFVPWERALLGALLGVAGALVSVVYFVGLWTIVGRTVGQLVLGLRVVAVDGSPMTVKRSLVRFAGYLVSALPLYAGFLWVLIDRDRRGWHDRIAGTVVVYETRRAQARSIGHARRSPAT